MASATGDVAPAPCMSEVLMEPLLQMQLLASNLFQSLSPPSTRPPPAPPTSSFIECDIALAKAVQQARIHQIKQAKIEKLKAEILALDTQLMDLWGELELSNQELEAIIDEGDERWKAIEHAKEATPYPELLAYAQSLSAFTSAPPNMHDIAQPGQPPPPLFFPPFPNEEKMRRGRLNAEAPLGQLGETHSVGRPPTQTPTADLSQPVQPSQIPRESYRPPPSRPQPLPAVDFGLDLNDDEDL